MALAESPISNGNIDIIIDAVGTDTVGARFAINDSTAIYGTIGRYYNQKDEEFSYNGTTQDLISTEVDKVSEIEFGAQMFLVDGFYALGGVALYTYKNTFDYVDISLPDVDYKYSGVKLKAGIGFEQALLERLSMHTSATLVLGNFSNEGTSTVPGGSPTIWDEMSRSDQELIFALGFSYNIK